MTRTSTMRLSDLCSLIASQIDPRTCVSDEVYVGLEHVAPGRMERIGVGEASEVQSTKHAFQADDVLYGKLRPYLDKAILARDPGICTTELLVLRSKSGVDPRFVVSVLHTPLFVEHAVSGTTGAQHPRTSWSHISNFELPCFSPEEQGKIANIVWQVHSAITANETAIGATAELKRDATRALYACGLRGDTQKETDIGPIPETWDVVEFEMVREWLQYGTSTRCTYEQTDFPVLRIPNVEPGRVNAQDIKFGDLSATDANRYRLQNGDLLFIRTNGVIERLGACAVYDGEPAGSLFASYLIRARLKLDRINPYFAAYFFASDIGIGLITGRATPAADGKYNMNTGTIDGLPVPLPPTLDEQKEIVAILDAIDRKIDLHRRKRAVLDDLFKTLLHKLMTGEIRVADLDLTVLVPADDTSSAVAE